MSFARHARFFDSRARHARHDLNTGAQGAKRAHVCAKKGSRAFRPCVCSSRVFRRLDIVRVAQAPVQ